MVRNSVFFFWFMLGLTGTSVNAQEIPEIGYFNLAAGGGKVYLSWQMEPGATCFGTQVHRSDDGESFVEIGGIEGVCGDLTKPVSYSFVDEAPPVNKRLYYKLELGTNNFTEVRFVDIIDLGDDPVQVRPNPVASQSRIYFSNGSKDIHTLTLTAISGQTVMQASTRADHFFLNAAGLAPGTYLFTIRSMETQQVLTGKVLIVR